MNHTWVILFGALLALGTPATAGAADVNASAGVSVSGMQILMTRHLAVSARATLDFVGVHGWTFGLRDEASFMPPLGGKDNQLSINNRTSFTAGYAWTSFTVSLGVGLAQYVMTACTTTLCARVSGLAPSADFSLVYYTDWLANSIGVQASGSVGWYTGSSRVLNGVPIVALSVGPVIRFGQFGGSR